MTHARTLPRYVSAFGLLACFMVAFPSLAQAAFPPGHPYHLDTARARITAKYATSAVEQMGTRQIGVTARVKHSGLPGAVTRYTNVQTYIPASKVRVAGLAALGRGVMHPGVQLAVAAAGFLWSQQYGIYTLTDSDNSTLDPADDDYAHQEKYWLLPQGGPPYYLPAHRTRTKGQMKSFMQDRLTSRGFYFCGWALDDNTRVRFISSSYSNCSYSSAGRMADIKDCSNSPNSTYCGTDYQMAEPVPTPVPTENLDQIDPYIEPSLIDELWNDQTWDENITHWSWDGSDLDPTLEQTSSDSPTTSEVMAQAQAQNENLYAQLTGEDQPNTDVVVDGNTADDEMLDQWNEPIPPFGDTDPDWQVETIDTMPDYDIGLAPGTCPLPVDVNVPLYGSFSISFQPACDLASWLRGVVIALSLIASLYIVLGTRRTV